MRQNEWTNWRGSDRRGKQSGTLESESGSSILRAVSKMPTLLLLMGPLFTSSYCLRAS